MIMKNEMELFNFEGNQVRTVQIDGKPYFVGKDIASILGYLKPADAVRKHVDSEDKGVSKMETPGGMQSYQVINESGLYSLILSSKLPSAKKFKHWVTNEVLPEIRQTGSYNGRTKEPSNVMELLQDPDNLLQLVTNYKDAKDENKKLKPKADYFDKQLDASSGIKTSVSS
jgi:prophage antirepressor-like protein